MSSADDKPGGNGGEADVATALAEPAEQQDNSHDQPADFEPPPDDDESQGGPRADQPIDAACSPKFTAVHNSGGRSLDAITLIVIHSTEGATAAGAAAWFANPRSGGSAHVVVDDHVCYRTLDDSLVPWGAPGANTNGFHVEHAGFAHWDRTTWMSHEKTLRRGAYKAAAHAVKFGVPLQLLTAEDLRHRRSGFVTHATVTKAFPQGSHTDPGPGFPLDHYMELVAEFAAQIRAS
jgi:hypothetical protein